jgi:glycosyltransferase involved in cell wall biosynthesis
LEAQAAGLPIVAGDRPGVGSVVAVGKSAVLVPEGDEVAFAAAVLALVVDHKQREAMSQAALQHVLAHHDLATAGRAFADTLAAFVAPRAGQVR